MLIHREPTLHPITKRKVAFLSGLSDPATCALSDLQQEFFAQLEISEDEKIMSNFPFRQEDAVTRPPPNILQASWENARQFLQAGRRTFRIPATKHWNALAQSCEELTVITLSCGLEILNACLIEGIRPQSLRVIALGPVAKSRPNAKHTLVQGSRDFISKPFFRNAEITLSGVGHLNYLERMETLEAVNQLLDQRA